MIFTSYTKKTVRHFASAVLLLITLQAADAQLLFNEMMASNASTLKDQFDEYPDWLEIYNPGDSIINLSNYWISDDSTLYRKWNLPEMQLNPDAYTVIFASGRDLRTSVSYWHTVVNTGDFWRYLAPTAPVSDDWKTSVSFTSGWSTGKAGIGYSDYDDSTIIGSTIALYMQKEFEISSVEEVTDAIFYMDYDDGFIAYLNGTEIARSATMGDPGTVFNYNDPALDQHEALMINGSSPEKFNISDRIGLLVQGTNVLAVEVHNVSAGSSDMTGNPFLLLGFNRLKAEFQYGNQYLVVSDVYPHANFRIQSSGEEIYLVNNNEQMVDKMQKVILPTDYSYGRTNVDTVPFGYYANPTPGWENGPDFSTEYFSDSVKFVSSGKNYDPSQQVEMISGGSGDMIFYTLDGSAPSDQSTRYMGPVTINQTTVVKARIYRDGSLPGPVTTQTFFTDKGHVLPVISISMDPFDLWDYNNGIYVLGPNAESSNPYFGANFWQDWEKPAYVEIYNADRQLVLSQGAGTKIYGAWSRAREQKSQAFYARSSYGKGSFAYPLFSEKPMKKYENFVLRNGGNDWSLGLFRDGLTAYLTAQMGVDHQAYEPYMMYLNGEFWGLMNMREKINEHFVAGNHNFYPEDVNIVEGDRWVVFGSAATYSQLYQYISDRNMADEANYEWVEARMDIGNYISFWAVNVYIDNYDWPGNNNKFWSTNGPGSRYRWISFDTDFGYGIYKNNAYTSNSLRFSLGEVDQNWANVDWATLMVRKLLANDEFKRRFINEFADRMNTIYVPENILPVIDSFQQRISLDAPDHFQRWGYNSVNGWRAEVLEMKNYFNYRREYMQQHLIDRFNLSGLADIELNVSDTEAGHVELNSLSVKEFPFTGTYFQDVPVDLEAVPAQGYAFSHWEGDIESSSATYQYDMHSPAVITAVFEPFDYEISVVINEINYASSLSRNTEDWVELYNRSLGPVDLSGWTLWDKSSGEEYEIPPRTVLQPKQYMVFSRHLPDFKRFYPEMKNLRGELPFGIDGSGDGIALVDPLGSIHDLVEFASTAPWPTEPLGTGSTLELINPGLNNYLAENWKASLNKTGTPGEKNTHVVSVGPELEIRSGFEAKVYPSPFSEYAMITFTLEERADVMITIYSATGSMVMAFDRAGYEPGKHTVTWTPGSMPAGIYLVHIRTHADARTIKVIYR